jgi:uncharacterized membrane protein
VIQKKWKKFFIMPKKLASNQSIKIQRRHKRTLSEDIYLGSCLCPSSNSQVSQPLVCTLTKSSKKVKNNNQLFLLVFQDVMKSRYLTFIMLISGTAANFLTPKFVKLLGAKSTLSIGYSILMACLLTLGYLVRISQTHLIQYVSTLLIFMYNFVFNITLGPLTFVIILLLISRVNAHCDSMIYNIMLLFFPIGWAMGSAH